MKKKKKNASMESLVNLMNSEKILIVKGKKSIVKHYSRSMVNMQKNLVITKITMMKKMNTIKRMKMDAKTQEIVSKEVDMKKIMNMTKKSIMRMKITVKNSSMKSVMRMKVTTAHLDLKEF